MQNTGVTNNTTAVNLIAAPGAGNQRQLRWCSINNTDTVDIGVKIRFNDNGSFRNVLYVYLEVNESIQYSEETGWRIYDANGSEKIAGFNKIPPAIRMPEGLNIENTSLISILSNGVAYCVYLGKADRQYSSVKIAYRIFTPMGATISYAELAIYKGLPTLGSAATLTRLGFTDTSAIWNSPGTKVTSVTTPGIAIGDDLWVVFGSSTTGTTPSIRAGQSNVTGAGFFQTVASARPSTNATLVGTVNSTSSMPWVAWEGVPLGT